MNSDKPWATASGPGEEYEDMLIGNREGLTKLKAAIEKAIAEGSVDVDDAGIEFNAIRVVDEDPRKTSSKSSQALFVLALIGILVLVVLGFIKGAEELIAKISAMFK